MTLASLKADLAELKATVASWVGDKAKATVDAIAAFQAKLTTLETGTVAELTQTTANLTTAQGVVSSFTTALMAACTAAKIELKAGMTPPEMLASLISNNAAAVVALETAKTDLTGKLSVATTEAAAKQTLIDAANGKLVAFLTNLKQAPAAGATLEQNATSCTQAITSTLAAQGIKVEALPDADATSGGGQAQGSLLEQYAELQKTKPGEATAFYEKNKAAIDKAWYASLK